MEFLEHYKLVLISQMGILPTLERFSSLLHRVLRTVYSLESALPKTEIDRAYLDRQHRLVAMDAGVARQYVLRSTASNQSRSTSGASGMLLTNSSKLCARRSSRDNIR